MNIKNYEAHSANTDVETKRLTKLPSLPYIFQKHIWAHKQVQTMQILHHQGAVYLEPQSNRASIHLDMYGTVGSKKEKEGGKKNTRRCTEKTACAYQQCFIHDCSRKILASIKSSME